MHLDYIIILLTVVFIVSILGYIAATLKEKIYLSNNMVVLSDKNVSQQIIDNVETRRFSVGSIEMMTGDEVKIYKKNFSIVKGMIIGANIKKKIILLSVHKSEPVEVRINGIKKIKIISRYGKFLRSF